MSDVQIPPTENILRCADLLDEAIKHALARRDSIPIDDLAHYEADWEAHIQLFITIRHLDSVGQLARADLCLYPSAMVLARSALADLARTSFTHTCRIDGKWPALKARSEQS